MQIIIAGDLVPTKSNEDLFNNGDIHGLLGGELNKIWSSSNIRLFNLEVPLVNQQTPILKCGPSLSAPTSTIKGIEKLSPSLVTLANNHILDQGTQGLQSTVSLLQQHDIPFVGVGNNVYHASEPYIIKKNGTSIGVYGCAENEFTIATDNSPGANPFDPLESLDHIQKLKSKCDYVIVLYHGGKEHYRYPSPNLQKICRKIAQKGADLIICQHSHCVGSYEKYEKSTIVYGQGNFIFNRRDNEFWNTSLLLKVSISDDLKIQYIPIVKNEFGVQLANKLESERILSGFYNRSKEILEEGFIDRVYSQFAQENVQSYLRQFSGFGKWLSRIDRRLLNAKILKRRYGKKQLLALQNYIECEAHRELVLQGIRENIEKIHFCD